MADEMDMIVTTPGDERLEPFHEANKQKVPWDKRVEMIHKQFPSVARLDWMKVFREDPTVLGRLINDILKVDAAQPGKPGKRPAVVSGEGHNRLRQLAGDDFSSYPFTEAFKILCGERSIRAVAAKTGLDRNLVHRLMNGADPSVQTMEQIAKAFKKEPGYFAEYRLAYLFAVMFYKLEHIPETTVGFYRKVKGLAK